MTRTHPRTSGRGRAASVAALVAIAAAVLVAMPSPGLAQTSPSAGAADQHAGHQHEHAAEHKDAPKELPPFIPRLTDEDRRAAFPDVDGHAVHAGAVNYLVLFDRLEWHTRDAVSGVKVDSRGWIGRDRDRVWFRADGDSEDGRIDDASAHVLYGRQFSRWWDVVAGIRQDFGQSPARTWAAIGVQGLAPYWFDVEATAYIGASGRTSARFEVEYELLFTNRLILQPLVEVDVHGKADPERGIGAGISTTEAGFRMRYEIRREIAPYAGVAWHRRWGETADIAEAAGESTSGARFVTGIRVWF